MAKNEFTVKVIKGQIDCGNRRNQWREFLAANEGGYLKVAEYKTVTGEMRRFFEGAVVPYFALQHFIPAGDITEQVMDGQKCAIFEQKHAELIDGSSQLQYRRMSQIEARELLKKNFHGMYLRDLDGDLTKISKSTTQLSKKGFMAFIERCTDYFMENGYIAPNSEEYKQWMDTSPMIGEIYPPLAELFKTSAKELARLNQEDQIAA